MENLGIKLFLIKVLKSLKFGLLSVLVKEEIISSGKTDIASPSCWVGSVMLSVWNLFIRLFSERGKSLLSIDGKRGRYFKKLQCVVGFLQAVVTSGFT